MFTLFGKQVKCFKVPVGYMMHPTGNVGFVGNGESLREALNELRKVYKELPLGDPPEFAELDPNLPVIIQWAKWGGHVYQVTPSAAESEYVMGDLACRCSCAEAYLNVPRSEVTFLTTKAKLAHVCS